MQIGKTLLVIIFIFILLLAAYQTYENEIEKHKQEIVRELAFKTISTPTELSKPITDKLYKGLKLIGSVYDQ